MTTNVWPESLFAMGASRVSISYGYYRTPTQRNTPKPSHPIKRLNTTHISAVNLKVVALVWRVMPYLWAGLTARSSEQSPPAYLKRTYLESTSVHSSPLGATKRRVEVLGYVEFTELLCDRNNWNGGLLIHMSQVRVLPGEPVFLVFF